MYVSNQQQHNFFKFFFLVGGGGKTIDERIDKSFRFSADTVFFFSGKPDLWSAHEIEVFQTDYCSDGFFLNLCHVILRMCQPFSAPNSEKLLKIKPSYCRAVVGSDKDRISKCVHARSEILVFFFYYSLRIETHFYDLQIRTFIYTIALKSLHVHPKDNGRICCLL